MNPITVQDILEAGKHASLTDSVLTEWAEKGTPMQREYLHGVLVAEHESRCKRLLKAARLPARKTLTGFSTTATSRSPRTMEAIPSNPWISSTGPRTWCFTGT